MRYLLDTNMLSDVIRNPNGRVANRVREKGDAAVCTSIIVAAELRFGAAKKNSRVLPLWWTRCLAKSMSYPGSSGRRGLRRSPLRS